MVCSPARKDRRAGRSPRSLGGSRYVTGSCIALGEVPSKGLYLLCPGVGCPTVVHLVMGHIGNRTPLLFRSLGLLPRSPPDRLACPISHMVPLRPGMGHAHVALGGVVVSKSPSTEVTSSKPGCTPPNHMKLSRRIALVFALSSAI